MQKNCYSITLNLNNAYVYFLKRTPKTTRHPTTFHRHTHPIGLKKRSPPLLFKQQAIVQILMKVPKFITIEEIILIPLINTEAVVMILVIVPERFKKQIASD